MLDTERSILASGVELTLARGEYLFRHQQEVEFAFYITNGTLEWSDGHQGPRTLTLRSCFLGLEELLLQRRHSHSARVLVPLVVWGFERSLIDALLRRHPHAGRYFLHKLCDNLARNGRGFE